MFFGIYSRLLGCLGLPLFFFVGLDIRFFRFVPVSIILKDGWHHHITIPPNPEPPRRGRNTLKLNYSRWWFQPIWKILVNLDHFPKVRGENKKYLSCHQPVNLLKRLLPKVGHTPLRTAVSASFAGWIVTWRKCFSPLWNETTRFFKLRCHWRLPYNFLRFP